MFPVHPAFARQIMEDRIAEARRDAAPRRIKRRLQGGEPAPITRRASEEAGAGRCAGGRPDVEVGGCA